MSLFPFPAILLALTSLALVLWEGEKKTAVSNNQHFNSSRLIHKFQSNNNKKFSVEGENISDERGVHSFSEKDKANKSSMNLP